MQFSIPTRHGWTSFKPYLSRIVLKESMRLMMADRQIKNKFARVVVAQTLYPGLMGLPVECSYCGGNHYEENCPTTFTPIKDCEHKDPIDGACLHPENMTPECHVGACPRLDRRVYDAWKKSLPRIKGLLEARTDFNDNA